MMEWEKCFRIYPDGQMKLITIKISIHTNIHASEYANILRTSVWVCYSQYPGWFFTTKWSNGLTDCSCGARLTSLVSKLYSDTYIWLIIINTHTPWSNWSIYSGNSSINSLNWSSYSGSGWRFFSWCCSWRFIIYSWLIIDFILL